MNAKSKKASRTELGLIHLEIIKRNVEYLVAHDRGHDLFMVLDHTGYLSNTTSNTSAELGAAIIALSSVISPHWLTNTVHASAFFRLYGSKKRKESRATHDRRWNRAARAGDAAVRGIVSEAVAA